MARCDIVILVNKIGFSFFCILFSLLFSCEVTSHQEDNIDSRNAGFVSLSTFEDGKILKAGEKVKYAFLFTDEETKVSSFRIDVVDLMTKETCSFGTVKSLAESDTVLSAENADSDQTIENDYDWKGTTVVPESLTDGYYALLFSFFDKEGKDLGSVEAAFFISSIALKIDSFGSYPVVIYPGGECLLYADITAPEKFDADVVWICNGVEIYRNRLKEMPSAIKWKAPQDKTAVEMTVGIYPSDPPIGESFDFPPSVSLSSTIFISENQPIEGGDFRPDSAYDLLFHFRGEMKNFAPGEWETVVKGEPQLALDANVFGYAFSDGAAVETECDGAVFFDVNGKAVPAFFDFRFNLKSDDSGRIFSLFDLKGKELFSFEKDEQNLRMQINSESGSYSRILDTSLFTLSDLNRASFYVAQNPESGEGTIVWFVDGYTVDRDVFPFEGIPVSTSYKAVIGGENGYSGVIDEVGIFKAVDRESNSLFAETVKRHFGEICVIADDFTCGKDSSIYTRLPERIDSGLAVIESNEILQTVPFHSENQFSVQMVLYENGFSGGCLEVKSVVADSPSEKTVPVVTVDLTNNRIVASDQEMKFKAAESIFGLYQLDFAKQENGWICNFCGESFPVDIPEGTLVEVSVSAADGESLTLDSLTVLKSISKQADLYQKPVSVTWQP